MLDVYSKAILMDFGIARIVGSQRHTATGAVVGTAMYMSPEQIVGERADERSDIYSLGVTLFETLSGKPPFESDSAMTLMMMHMNDPAPDVRELQPDVPPELAAIVRKSLEKKRENRFQSAEAMAAALRQAADRIRNPQQASKPAPRMADFPAEHTVVNQPVGGTFVEEPVVNTFAEPPVEHTVVEDILPARTGAMTGQRQADRTVADYDAQGQSSVRGTGGYAQTGGQRVVTQSDPRLSVPPINATQRPALRLHPALLIAGGVGAFGLVALVVIIFLALQSFGGGDQTPTPDFASASSETSVAETVVAAVAALTPEATATFTPAPTSTTAPTATYNPPTETPTATLVPTETVPPGPYVRINGITIKDGYYVVDYETFEYTEQLPGTHIHFFFDTVKPEQAGSPGRGPWILYGGPRPFSKYKVADRPYNANQMCALVANPNHSVKLESGSCYDLPN
jgi:hypothetical protein